MKKCSKKRRNRHLEKNYFCVCVFISFNLQLVHRISVHGHGPVRAAAGSRIWRVHGPHCLHHTVSGLVPQLSVITHVTALHIRSLKHLFSIVYRKFAFIVDNNFICKSYYLANVLNNVQLKTQCQRIRSSSAFIL